MRASSRAFSVPGSPAAEPASRSVVASSDGQNAFAGPCETTSRPTGATPCPASDVERAERLSRLTPQRPDRGPVVLVVDPPGAMIGLELLQRRERPIALLGEGEAPPPLRCELVELVGEGLRLAQERQRDQHDAADGERRAQHDRDGHRPRTVLPASS